MDPRTVHLALSTAATLLLALAPQAAFSETFKCKSADGKMVFQDLPCRPESAPESQASAQADRKVQAENARANAEREKARRKAEAEAEGDRRLALEPDHEQADAAARMEEARRPDPNGPPNKWVEPYVSPWERSGPSPSVPCALVRDALETTGRGFFERAALMGEARRTGQCK